MMLFAYFEVHVLLHIFAFETLSFKGAITISKDFCSANVHVHVLWNHLWDTCRFILVLRYSLYPEVRFGMNITKIINFSCYSEGVWKFIHFIFIYFRYMYLSFMTLWCYSFSTNFIFECSMFEFLIVIYFVCVNSRLRILWNVILICKQYLQIQTTQLYINEYQGTTFMYSW